MEQLLEAQLEIDGFIQELQARIDELETALSISVETLAPFAAAYMLVSPLDHIHREDLARAAAVTQRWGKGVGDG